MITVTITKHNDLITGFELSGHAGWAEEGSDIVCAAVSALAINTVNSIEKFTEDAYVCEEPDEENGFLSFSIENPSENASLILNSLELGLQSVAESYGKEFLEIIYIKS